MLIWDEAKRAANIAKHRVDFTAAETLDLMDAVTAVDNRFDCGDIREVSIGIIADRLHVLVFTRRGPDIRVISLRRANDREEQVYVEAGKA